MHQRIGENPYMCVVDDFEAVDIDEPEDFDLLKQLHGIIRKKEYYHEECSNT